jgi:hypothetical protein
MNKLEEQEHALRYRDQPVDAKGGGPKEQKQNLQARDLEPQFSMRRSNMPNTALLESVDFHAVGMSSESELNPFMIAQRELTLPSRF